MTTLKHFKSLLMSFQTQRPEPKSRFSAHLKNGKSSPSKNNVTVSAFHRITREIGNHDFLYEVCVWPPRARPPLPATPLCRLSIDVSPDPLEARPGNTIWESCIRHFLFFHRDSDSSQQVPDDWLHIRSRAADLSAPSCRSDLVMAPQRSLTLYQITFL